MKLFVLVILLKLFGFTLSQSQQHPLDPLTPAEIGSCSQIVQKTKPSSTGYNFVWITLLEPEKKFLLPASQQQQGQSIPRKCLAVIIERGTGRGFEARVNLGSNRIEKWDQLPPDAQPLIAPEENQQAIWIFRNDTNVRERCARLGYTNMENVAGHPWTMGYIDDRPEFKGRRLMQVFSYGLNHPDDNQFAHPFDFIGIVDLVQEKLIAIEDLPVHHQFYPKNKNQGVTVPRREANYDTALLRNASRHAQPQVQHSNPWNSHSQARPRVLPRPRVYAPAPPPTYFSPVYTGQPFYRFKRQTPVAQGQPISLQGNALKWENFKIRIGFNAREGLILNDIWFQDGARARPLIYRMSMVEMVVPYADPRPPYHRKVVFDTGEFGMGFSANSLQPGVDCGRTAVFGHFAINNLRGSGSLRRNVYCAYEEEVGLLFKHTNTRNRRVTFAKNRRLVISSISTVGNYDYAFFWFFGLDGSIEFTVKATGLLDTELLAQNESTFGYGTEVFPQINAQYHQHHFVTRIDPMFDGVLNSAAVIDVLAERAEPGSQSNPYGQAFAPQRKQLETVSEACTRIDASKSRSWEIFTPKRNLYAKEPQGWRLIPRNVGPVLVRRDSPLFPKLGFANYDVWVTNYKDEEIYPAGFYLNGRNGLPQIVKRDPQASIVEQDIVFWHVFGLTHVPRTEDFPIMPIEETGFSIRPHNFFEQNPALNYGTTFTLPREQ